MLLFVLLFGWAFCVQAYLPAVPTNNVSTVHINASTLLLDWPGGVYGSDVSYQLVGSSSKGFSKVNLRAFYHVRIWHHESIGRVGSFHRGQ